MTEPKHDILRFVESPAGLQAAVEFTAAETGFIPALIEKDYWCSVVLWRLFSEGDCPLVFKGGTLLSKAYVTLKMADEPHTDWLASSRIEAFRRSIDPELRPVLRPDAYDSFDFEAALASMIAVAEALQAHLPRR